MATTTKALFRGAATTSTGTTLYTVPSATTAVISNIVLSNTAGSSSTATISLDGINVVPTVSIPANTVIAIDLKQVLATTKIIAGGASTTAVTIHISGVEIA
jgi:hypothetical protein